MPFSGVKVIAIPLLLLSAIHNTSAFLPAFACSKVLTVSSKHSSSKSRTHDHRMVSSGFSFEDGKQILVSVQKPLGVVLEQDVDGLIIVTEIDLAGSAGRAGVRVGDVLVAVQNASVKAVDLDSVLNFIQKGPRVINLRFIRDEK